MKLGGNKALGVRARGKQTGWFPRVDAILLYNSRGPGLKGTVRKTRTGCAGLAAAAVPLPHRPWPTFLIVRSEDSQEAV